MVAFVLALASWAGDRADAAVVGHWLQAAATDSQAVKYEALGRGLAAIDRGQYTRRRADAIGLLYGSLLAQNVPAPTKHHICGALARMEGLGESVDVLLEVAGRYKAEAEAKKRADRAPFRVGIGSPFAFRPAPDEERLADDLIAALWTRKSGGRSHLSGALPRLPPYGAANLRFSR